MGRPCLALVSDVADVMATKAVIERVVEQFGRLAILVNNAGIMLVARSRM
mgnify:CR=1 FL=1